MYDKLNAIRERKQTDDRGFTLIELLVVVVIIGVLIAIAIPLYLSYQHGAKDKSAQSDLRAAVSAINQCYTDNGNAYPASVTWSGSVGTPAGTACASDKLNISDGTTLTYALKTAGDTSSGFTLSAYNSGGNHSSGNPFRYDSTVGGSIDGATQTAAPAPAQ